MRTARSSYRILIPKETSLFYGTLKVNCLDPIDRDEVFLMLFVKHFRSFHFQILERRERSVLWHPEILATNRLGSNYSDAYIPLPGWRYSAVA